MMTGIPNGWSLPEAKPNRHVEEQKDFTCRKNTNEDVDDVLTLLKKVAKLSFVLKNYRICEFLPTFLQISRIQLFPHNPL